MVHKGKSEKVVFKPSKQGLYYHDMKGSKEVSMAHVQENEKVKQVRFEKDSKNIFTMTTAHLEHISDQVTLVETVRDNEEGFTAREVAGARKARDALRLIGFPSVKDFKGMVRGNIVRNCPVTEQDIKNWLTIYGPDIASLKGKSVRNASRAVVSDYVHVPREIYERNKMVVLGADVMYVSGIKFLVTV